jgi:hypothetical protein
VNDQGPRVNDSEPKADEIEGGGPGIHPGVVLGPLLFAAGLAVIAVSNALVTIGPFDRAQVGGAVGLPLLLLAPGVYALAFDHPDPVARRRAALLLAGLASVVAILMTGWLAVTVTRLGCSTLASPLEALPSAVPMGIVAGLLVALPVIAAAREGRGGHGTRGVFVGGVAMLFGIGAALVLAAYWLFPVVSCASPS